MLKKQFISKSTIDDDERTVTAVITTTAIDRDKEVLLAKGAKLDHYLKSPVVLWAHQYSEVPVAKSLWIKAGNKRITAKMEFATKEQSPKADEIYQLFKGGFLNAFSVGFLPSKAHTPTPDEIKKKPEWAEANRIYDEWELLEFSAVPVPANPEALATAVKSKAIDLSFEMKEELNLDDEVIYYTANTVTKAYNCECLKCGHKLSTDKHCADIKCPECGGEMRRAERPGPGRSLDADNVLEVEGLQIEPIKVKTTRIVTPAKLIVLPVMNVTKIVEVGIKRARGIMY